MKSEKWKTVRLGDEEGIIKDVWENGHHTKIIVDSKTLSFIANAYEEYKITHTEYITRKQCRASLLCVLSKYFGKVFTNKDSNIKARFSKNTANKLASDKAITKSVVNGFLPEEHFEAAENIKGIFEQAEYIGSLKKCIAYITLKEVKKEGSRIYTQELLLNEYPPHEAGELTSRGLKTSETTAYKCSPRTDLSIQHKR